MIRFCLIVTCFLVSAQGTGLKEEFTWSRISYVWPQESRFGYGPGLPTSVGDGDIAFPGAVNMNRPSKPSGGQKVPPGSAETSTSGSVSGSDTPENVDYIYENNVPMGANRWGDKLFVSVPRRRAGVPSTLNYVSMSSKERHNVPLTPYPNWEMNQLTATPPDRIVSVYRISIDPCDRLWMVDTGVIEVLGNRTDVQPHSIVIIDLKTDKIIKRYQLKESDLRPPTVLAFISVDVTADKCDEAYAYMPDLAGYGLVVYSLKDDDSWRFTHNYFYLEPTHGDFRIGGHQFQWNDGIFSVALSDVKNDGFRDLYFHSMAGIHLYKVSTKILQNKENAERSYHGDDFIDLGERGNLQQTSGTDLHKSSGVLFLSLVNQNALGCWNTNTPFTPANFDIVQKHDEKMIYPCDLKIYKDDVILITNNMPIFLYGKLNYDETNFRVWMNSVSKAVEGTKCAAPRTVRGKGKYQG